MTKERQRTPPKKPKTNKRLDKNTTASKILALQQPNKRAVPNAAATSLSKVTERT